MASKQIPLQNTYYLIRHGQALSNVSNILISSIELSDESPLTDQGIQEIEHLGLRLHTEQITGIISSDFLRTRQTAGILATQLGVPILLDKRLRERYLGDFNGKHIDTMRSEVSLTDLQWNTCSHRMEPYQYVLDRMIDLLRELEQTRKGEHIVLVSHSAPLRILMGWFLGIRGAELSPRSITMNQVTELANGEVIKVTERTEKELG